MVNFRSFIVLMLRRQERRSQLYEWKADCSTVVHARYIACHEGAEVFDDGSVRNAVVDVDICGPPCRTQMFLQRMKF